MKSTADAPAEQDIFLIEPDDEQSDAGRIREVKPLHSAAYILLQLTSFRILCNLSYYVDTVATVTAGAQGEAVHRKGVARSQDRPPIRVTAGKFLLLPAFTACH